MANEMRNGGRRNQGRQGDEIWVERRSTFRLPGTSLYFIEVKKLISVNWGGGVILKQYEILFS